MSQGAPLSSIRLQQLWTGQGRCLFCSIRAPLISITRSFSQTPHRSRKKSKKSALASDPAQWRASARRGLAIKDFPMIVETALKEYRATIPSSSPLLRNWDKFKNRALQASKIAIKGDNAQQGSLHQLKATLQQSYLRGGMQGLKGELKALFNADDITAKYSTPYIEDQKKIVDMRYPAEWYPRARAMQRTIHLHVGPTNSGKTYHSLKRLEQSQRGFYAGPLRLLAQEVYSRFKAQGIECALITGDEVRLPDNAYPRITSNTVEMVSLSKDYDVGVIDEIQMIADPRRGWAWTRALLGTRVAELHLCGETRTVPLIKELVALTGDVLHIHNYERLNPLKVEDESLRGDLRKLRKGDCLVSFSRVNIHTLKNDIEKATGRRAAIVYGSLPAEIRTQQANLFNDPDNDYDFLVASDAIGMGLNLKCKRIIFETLIKRLPGGLTRLTVPEIKQIAGRAGRYRAANEQNKKTTGKEEPNVGYVTSLEEVDLPYIKQALNFEPPPIKAAGVIPPDPMFQAFSAYFPPSVPFQYLIKRIMALAQMHPLFFMCEPTSQLVSAAITDKVQGLTIEDKLVFMAAPLYAKDAAGQRIVEAFARCVAQHTGGRLLDIPELNLEILECPVSGNKEYMHQLEQLHKAILLYLWLSYRMGGVFTDRALATHVKEMLEQRMMRALTEFSANKKLRRDASLRRQIALQRQNEEERRLLEMAGVTGDGEQGATFGLSMDEAAAAAASNQPASEAQAAYTTG